MPQLPGELMSLVCLRLRPIDDEYQVQQINLRALTNLCLTSRPWRRAARPHLYHTLNMEDRENERLRPMLRILLAEPKLCSQVKAIRLNRWRILDPEEDEPLSDECEAVEDALVVPWEKLDFGLSDDDMTELQLGIRVGLQDAEVALLLYLCHRLTHLSFSTVRNFPYSLVHTAISQASADRSDMRATHDSAVVSKGSRPLQYVCKAAVLDQDVLGAFDADDLGPVLRLPSLVHFRCNRICWHANEDRLNLPELTTRLYLRSFKAESSCFDAPAIEWLLKQCPSLEVLSLDRAYDYNCGSEAFDFNRISAAVVEFGKQLKCLAISSRNVGEMLYDTGSLRNAARLTTVSLPVTVFYDTDRPVEDESRMSRLLPPSLESLEITDGDENDIRPVDIAVLDKLMHSEHYPDLCRMVIPRHLIPPIPLLEVSQWEGRKDGEGDQARVVFDRFA